MKLDRLKSLPLTIALTLLIWVYADTQVRTEPEHTSQIVVEVPVVIAAPMEIINNSDVYVEPQNVNVTLTGTREALNGMDKRMVTAYLDLDWGDRGIGSMTRKTLRVTVPNGIIVAHPVEVNFKVIEKTPLTRRAGM